MIFELVWHRVLRTVTNASMQTTDISFPRSREGYLKPLKTLWGSTVGVQSPSTLATNPHTTIHENDWGFVRYTLIPLLQEQQKIPRGRFGCPHLYPRH